MTPMLSPLTWGRGLKFALKLRNALPDVAPHVGAWIEIHLLTSSRSSLVVAPHVGAWIEILANMSL